MSHVCHIIDCHREIPPRMFACLRHWRMVSPALQRALWREYRTGQEIDKIVSKRYLVAQALCRLAVTTKEHPEDWQVWEPGALSQLRESIGPAASYDAKPFLTDLHVISLSRESLGLGPSHY